MIAFGENLYMNGEASTFNPRLKIAGTVKF